MIPRSFARAPVDQKKKKKERPYSPRKKPQRAYHVTKDMTRTQIIPTSDFRIINRPGFVPPLEHVYLLTWDRIKDQMLRKIFYAFDTDGDISRLIFHFGGEGIYSPPVDTYTLGLPEKSCELPQGQK